MTPGLNCRAACGGGIKPDWNVIKIVVKPRSRKIQPPQKIYTFRLLIGHTFSYDPVSISMSHWWWIAEIRRVSFDYGEADYLNHLDFDLFSTGAECSPTKHYRSVTSLSAISNYTDPKWDKNHFTCRCDINSILLMLLCLLICSSWRQNTGLLPLVDVRHTWFSVQSVSLFVFFYPCFYWRDFFNEPFEVSFLSHLFFCFVFLHFLPFLPSVLSLSWRNNMASCKLRSVEIKDRIMDWRFRNRIQKFLRKLNL